jgi:hypothetical protein
LREVRLAGVEVWESSVVVGPSARGLKLGVRERKHGERAQRDRDRERRAESEA